MCIQAYTFGSLVEPPKKKINETMSKQFEIS